MAPEGGPLTQKTLSRPPDRWPDEDVLALSKKYTGLYYGDKWYVHHNLSSTDLIIDVWLDSSTQSARYSSAVQATDKDIIIEWDTPARGKCVVFAIGGDLQDALIHHQTQDSDEWLIDHQFGTDNLICDVWIDGKRVDPTLISLDLFTVSIKFPTPCQGKACIMVSDPSRSKEIEVSYLNLKDVPECFDPCKHIHTDPEDIPLAYDSQRLGGIEADFWLNTDDLGDLVCELDEDGKIPSERLPGTANVIAGDYDQELSSQRILVDSRDTPLFAKKQTTEGVTTVIVSSRPVTRYVALEGDPGHVEIPKNTDNRLIASANWDMKFFAGSGIKFRKVDNNSFQISTMGVSPSIFKRSTPLFKGSQWQIPHPVFETPGEQIMNLYEFISVGGVQESTSNHIPGMNLLEQVFAHQGADLMNLSYNKLETKLYGSSDHFFWDEHVYDTSTGAILLPMANMVNMGYDNILDKYVVTYRDYVSGYWTFYTMDTNSGAMTMLSSIPIDPDMPLLDVRHGWVYGIRGAVSMEDTNRFELVRSQITSLPNPVWSSIAVFTGVAYPPDLGKSIVFHFHDRRLFIFEETFNRLTVYNADIPTFNGAFTKIPPIPCTAFDIWPDGYLSFAHSNSGITGAYTSNMPATDPSHSYRLNIEKHTGQAKFIAIGRLTGLGIKSDGRWVNSNEIYITANTIYNTGEAIYWTKSKFAWEIPFQYTRVFDIDWEDLDLSGLENVRIGFTTTPMGDTIPETLLAWSGTDWYSFDTADIATQGSDLSVIKSVNFKGSDVVGYAIYIKKSDPFETGYIVNNFKFSYMLASVLSPLPMSYNGDNNSVKATIYPNLMVIENVQDRAIEGMTLVVTPT